MSHRHLDARLTPNIDFTRRDEITFSLLDAIKCSISMEIYKNMIIFNHQYYDHCCFDRYERIENTRNHRRVSQGEIELDKMSLKDPRTGMNFNLSYAIHTLFIARPSRANLALSVKNCIPEITKEEINAFVPDQDDQKTNTEDFINLIRTMTHSREVNSDACTRHIQNLQRSAASNSASPSNLQLPSKISQQST